MQIKATFAKDRETKGAVLYKEIGANGHIIENMYDCKIGSLYIRKTALNGEAIPNEIEVTVKSCLD